MANFCALWFVVVVMAITVDAGYMDVFQNWRHVYRCPRDFVKSKFHLYAPYVNHLQLILDLEAVDKDNNDDITRSEFSDLSAIGIDLVAGISRCEFVKMYESRYGIKPAISSHVFTGADTNKDGRYTTSDVKLPKDKNGDGKISVCELYNSFLSRLDFMGKKEYDRQAKARQIKADTDFYNDPHHKDWLSTFWSFFNSSWN